MLKAVIFDFDGVITDSEILHFRAFNQVLKQHGFELTKEDYYKTYLGYSDADCYEALIKEGRLKVDKAQIRNLMDKKKVVYKDIAKAEGKLIEGVRDFLIMLDENSIPMAICSGSLLSEVEMMLEGTGLRHLFKEIVSGEQVKKGKPDPEGYLLTLERLNNNSISAQMNNKNHIEPNECVVIEDSHWGLQAAKAAGMHVIAVTTSYGPEQLGMAEKIIDQLNELSIDDLKQLCV
ncbi:MAG: HAD family phosphatase [Sedimentisphaerales bacterium]|nr:HAD family phosphatase [Sedimentisphaerales bacterium]